LNIFYVNPYNSSDIKTKSVDCEDNGPGPHQLEK